MLNTERSYNDVSGLPDSNTFLAQFSKIFCALDCHVPSKQVEYGKLLQQTLGGPVVLVVPKALKNFCEDQVAYSDGAIAQRPVKKIGLRRPVTAEIVNPDAGIHENHEVCLMSSRSPDQSSLPLNRLIPSCFFNLINVLRPSSTVSFLVFSPVDLSASAISLSSISMFVRMVVISLQCVLKIAYIHITIASTGTGFPLALQTCPLRKR